MTLKVWKQQQQVFAIYVGKFSIACRADSPSHHDDFSFNRQSRIFFDRSITYVLGGVGIFRHV